jgi:hypothetical protein
VAKSLSEQATGSCSIAKKKKQKGKVGCGCPWFFFTCPKILSTQDPPNPSSHVSNEDARLSFAHHQASGVLEKRIKQKIFAFEFSLGSSLPLIALRYLPVGKPGAAAAAWTCFHFSFFPVSACFPQ